MMLKSIPRVFVAGKAIVGIFILLFSTASAKERPAVVTLDIDSTAAIAVEPRGQFLIERSLSGDSLTLHDLSGRRTLLRLTARGAEVAGDGTIIAWTTDGRVMRVDATSGATLAEVALPLGAAPLAASIVNDRAILLDKSGALFVDVFGQGPRTLVATGSPRLLDAATLQDGRFVAVDEDGAVSLLLPDRPAQATAWRRPAEALAILGMHVDASGAARIHVRTKEDAVALVGSEASRIEPFGLSHPSAAGFLRPSGGDLYVFTNNPEAASYSLFAGPATLPFIDGVTTSLDGGVIAIRGGRRVVVIDAASQPDLLRQLAVSSAAAEASRLSLAFEAIGGNAALDALCAGGATFGDSDAALVAALSEVLQTPPSDVEAQFRRSSAIECEFLRSGGMLQSPLSPEEESALDSWKVGQVRPDEEAFRTLDSLSARLDMLLGTTARTPVLNARATAQTSGVKAAVELLVGGGGKTAAAEPFRGALDQRQLVGRLNVFQPANRTMFEDAAPSVANSGRESAAVAAAPDPSCCSPTTLSVGPDATSYPARPLSIPEAAPSMPPPRSATESLPRDALYVRRNNQFGTQKETISQVLDRGVLVDQEVITFDDFIGPDATSAASPAKGSALAMSIGVTEIPEELRREDLATHFVMIALRAADEAPAQAHTVPVAGNNVFVIDRSGSMQDTPIDLARQTVFRLYEQISDEDAIGIVAFSDTVQTVVRTIKKRDLAPDRLRRALDGLKAEGGTDLNLGVGFGLEELSRIDEPARAQRLIVLSDGEPTSGETDWSKIRRSLAEGLRTTPAQLTAFALGPGANFRELDSLAGVSGGRAEQVIDGSDLDDTLSEEIARQEHLAVMGMELRFTLEETVGFRYIYGHDPITDPAARRDVLDLRAEVLNDAAEQLGVALEDDLLSGKGVQVFVPNLAYGETYLLLLEVALPANKDPRSKIATLEAQFVDVPNRRPVRINSMDVREGDDGVEATSIVVSAMKLASSEIVFSAINDIRQNRRADAADRLRAHAARLSTAADRFGSKALREDSITISKFLRLAGNIGLPRVRSDSGGYRGASLVPVTTLMFREYAERNNGFMRAQFYTPASSTR